MLSRVLGLGFVRIESYIISDSAGVLASLCPASHGRISKLVQTGNTILPGVASSLKAVLHVLDVFRVMTIIEKASAEQVIKPFNSAGLE